MRTFTHLLPLLAALLLVAPPSPAFSGFVEVRNETGRDIHLLQVSHQKEDDWGADVLDGDVLRHGRAARIDIDGYPGPFVDLRATDAFGDSYTFVGVNVARTDVVIRAADRDARPAGVDGYIRVTNRTGSSIVTLYVSRADPPAAETDVLDDTVLADGQSVAVVVSTPLAGVLDLRAVDEVGASYTRRGVDIAGADVTFTGRDQD